MPNIPQKKVQEDFLKKHAGNPSAVRLIEEQPHEAGLYDRYKAFYGYVIFIGKKVE